MTLHLKRLLTGRSLPTSTTLHRLSKLLHSSPDPTAPSTTLTTTVATNDSNEFLSRFVHHMRPNLTAAYPTTDKPTIDAMLLLIIKTLLPSCQPHRSTLSDDLLQTVAEVTDAVRREMERERKKETMKHFLQSDRVKSMARFASEVGVRGDMLRELRFKWAREVMEESEFYESLNRLRQERDDENVSVDENVVAELPKRHGKINYGIYGLDLSSIEWMEMADKVHEAEEVAWPSEAKPITGKCKVVMEKIVGALKVDDLSSLLGEWVELLQPGRVEWDGLLDRIKERDMELYLKVLERVLNEPSFQADSRDYSMLVNIYAKENRLEDVERSLGKMSEKGMSPDTIVLPALVHMYSTFSNLERAKETFETLESNGFQPSFQVYRSMIIAYVNAGEPNAAEGLIRKMEIRDMERTDELLMSVMQGYAQRGDVEGVRRMETNRIFAGYKPTLESCTLLVEVNSKAGRVTDARDLFDSMVEAGIKPDDRCIAMMVSAYEKRNELDKALHLLMGLEKEKFEPGVFTYCVLVDWLGKLLLVDEVEQILGKIAQLGEAPPFKIQVSLCDMYARAGLEKKALQALGVLEAKKELLDHHDFERVIDGLLKGQFVQDASRIRQLMEDQGFTVSEVTNVRIMSPQVFGHGSKRP